MDSSFSNNQSHQPAMEYSAMDIDCDLADVPLTNIRRIPIQMNMTRTSTPPMCPRKFPYCPNRNRERNRQPRPKREKQLKKQRKQYSVLGDKTKEQLIDFKDECDDSETAKSLIAVIENNVELMNQMVLKRTCDYFEASKTIQISLPHGETEAKRLGKVFK